MLARIPSGVPALLGRTAAWVERRRSHVAVAVCAAAMLTIATAFIVRGAADVALFDAPMHADQIAEVASALTLWGEPHTSAPSGDQIFVAASRREAVLLRLTLAGLPHAHVPTSADVLAEPYNALAPSTLEDDRRRLGIEGDLVAALRRIAGVADAAVIITPANTDIAALGESAQPSAAVQIVTRPGAGLAPAAVDGIRSLVAAAAPGLRPDRVSVTDENGVLLKTAPSSDTVALREARLQSSVQTALDAVFGAGAAVVRVRVIANGSEVSSQSTRVTPHGLLDADAGREHGADGGRAFDKERHIQHYAYDTIVERRSAHADAVRRISVAVFLDARRVDARRRDDVAALVRASAGADLRSGDDVVVGVLPFAAPHAAVAARPQAVSSHGRLAVAAAAAIAVLIVTVVGACWPKLRAHTETASIPRIGAADAIGSALGSESARTAAYVLRGMPAAVRARVLAQFDEPQRISIQACMDERDDG